MNKPDPKKYGFHDQQGFDDEPSGWLIEGGEEAYEKALQEWNRKEAALKMAQNEYDDPQSSSYRDNERYSWAVRIINNSYEQRINEL